MITQVFTNRTGNNLNRRKIKIISQSADEIIADIELADEPDENSEGTVFNAELMNSFKDTINVSEEKAIEAHNAANEALTKANEALQQVVEKQGTKVFVGGEYKSTFDADSKVQKVEFDEFKTNNTQDLASLQSDLMNQIESLRTQVSSLNTEIQNKILQLQTELSNMKNGTSVFTLLKANTIDLVD